MKKLNKWLFAIGTCTFMATSSFAQTSLNPWAISIDGNFKEYSGEYGKGAWKFSNPNIQVGIGGWRYINSWVDAGLSLNYGKFTHDPQPWVGVSRPNLEYKGLQTTLTGRLKFNNGKWLKENAFIAPYLTLGFGFYSGTGHMPTQSDTSFKAKAFNIPMGAGVRFNLTPQLKLIVQSSFCLMFKDDFDNKVIAKPNDRMWEHKIGFAWCFGKGKEAETTTDTEKK